MKTMEYALIVAAGSGQRMKSEVPKQFLPVSGLPLLIHTINAFRDYSSEIQIILVLSDDSVSYWEKLSHTHEFNQSLQVVNGGATRFLSVQNGLSQISGDGLVAIHDGVRPLVEIQIIADSFKAASQYGSGVAAVPVKESLRKIDGETNKAVDRSAYRHIQTPQTFQVQLIKDAFEKASHDQFTDDASVYEHAGHPIHLIPGNYKNIKITTPEDMAYARLMLGEIG